MRRYCLTKCAKRKLSSALEVIIQTTTAVTVIILMLVLIGAVSIGFGYFLVHVIGVEPIKDGYGALGFAWIVLIVIFTGVSLFIFKVAKKISIKTVNFVKDRYEGKEIECKIFEECKDEE